MLRYVLIVEDDPLVVSVIAEILSSMGYRVLTASSGVEALELYRQYTEQIGCILLDYGIPDMHATRLFAKLRGIRSDAKIILSSGYPLSVIRRDFPIEEISGFIPKPYDPLLLREEITKLAA